jgi:hypothetical protein
VAEDQIVRMRSGRIKIKFDVGRRDKFDHFPGVGAELGSGADTGSNTDIIQALGLTAASSLKLNWTASGSSQSQGRPISK